MSDVAVSRSGWFSHLHDGHRRGGGLCLHHPAHHAGGAAVEARHRSRPHGQRLYALAQALTTLYLSWLPS